MSLRYAVISGMAKIASPLVISREEQREVSNLQQNWRLLT
jgi:hypothetical protein